MQAIHDLDVSGTTLVSGVALPSASAGGSPALWVRNTGRRHVAVAWILFQEATPTLSGSYGVALVRSTVAPTSGGGSPLFVGLETLRGSSGEPAFVAVQGLFDGGSIASNTGVFVLTHSLPTGRVMPTGIVLAPGEYLSMRSPGAGQPSFSGGFCVAFRQMRV